MAEPQQVKTLTTSEILARLRVIENRLARARSNIPSRTGGAPAWEDDLDAAYDQIGELVDAVRESIAQSLRRLVAPGAEMRVT